MSRNFVSMAFAGLIIHATAVSTVIAQDGSSVSIQRDDAGGARIRHISMPNLEALRTPDFTRKELPIFHDKLLLSEAQTSAVGQRIDGYLAAFIALTKDLATLAGPNAEFSPAAEDDDAAKPAGAPAAMQGPMAGPGVAFDDLEAELPPGSQVGVTIAVGIDDGGDDDGADAAAGGGGRPQMSADVQVGIETPGGEEVSPELLEKFQQRADELAAKVAEQVGAQQEARAAGAPLDGPPQGPGALLADPEEMERRHAELSAKIEEFLKAKAKLRSTFVVETQGDLAVEQIERWPALERALTRERSLPKGRVSGESTDLVKLVASQKLPDSSVEALAAEIEAYEIDLDGALKRRDAFLADASQAIDQAMSSGDADKAISIAEKAADLRVAVRKANQTFAERMALELGGAEGEAFRLAALQAFYPNVYRVTRAHKMFDAIDRMEGVPADVAAAVADSRRAYEGELASMNDRLRQTIDREEPRERLRSLEQLKRTMQGENMSPHGEPALTLPDDPIRAALDKRADLDDRYLKTVASLMPAELAAALPKPRTHKGPIVVRSGNR